MELQRSEKFKAAALELANDAVAMAAKVRKSITRGDYERAADAAAILQRAARDAKWLMQRQPRS